MPHISVVVPVYNEEASTLSEFVLQLKTALAAITDDFELILVDDGSQNDAWVSIVSLSRADRRVMGIRFTRNFGQHAAIAAGIDHANGDWVVVMDRSDTLTYRGVISGTGSLTQAGTGTTILTGANTYTGATNVNAGTLQAGANTTFAQNSAFTIAAGASQGDLYGLWQWRYDPGRELFTGAFVQHRHDRRHRIHCRGRQRRGIYAYGDRRACLLRSDG